MNLPMNVVLKDRFDNLDNVCRIINESQYPATIIQFPKNRITVQKEMFMYELEKFIRNDITDLEFILIPEVVSGTIKIVVFPNVESA